MLKRPLIFAVLLFLLGIFLVAYSVNLIVATVLCLGVLGFIFFKTRKPLVLAWAIFFILAGMGRMGIAENQRDKITAAYAGKTETMELVASEFSEGASVQAYFTDDGKKYHVLLRFEDGEALSPGDIVKGEITLDRPYSSKLRFPGYAQSLAGDNIFLVANTKVIHRTGEREGGISGAFSSLRIYMDDLGKRHFSGDDRALFNAMVIGDKRLISDKLGSSLRASGLNHLAVVSGMHLSVAIAFLAVIAKFLFGKKKFSYIFILLGAFVIMLLTGAGLSAIRAFIMCAIYLVSQMVLRDNDSPSSLSLAVFLMVMVNPFMIFNVGFIMSVLSVAGILLYERKILGALRRFIPDKMANMLSLSISAQLTVLPVAVYYFGTVSSYSLLSNALLVPIAGIYVILGMLFILFSAIPGVSYVLAFVMKLFSGCICSVSEWVESLPGSLVKIDGNFLVFLAVWVILLVLFAIHPIDRKKYHLAAASVTVVLVCTVMFMPADKTEIYPITYGSKTMTVVHFREGESFLIDYPDHYDACNIAAESNEFETLVLSGNDSGKFFFTDSNTGRIIAHEKVLRSKEKHIVATGAQERKIPLILLGDYEKFQVGNAVIEYIPVEGFDECRILKVYCEGKTYLSFQGISGTDIMQFGEHKMRFESDYVILPYTAFACDRGMFSGEILGQN